MWVSGHRDGFSTTTCVAGTVCYPRANREAQVAGDRNKAEGNIAHSFDLYGWGAEGVRT
jgi:hypothetical protein